jgi:hypothetical protein
MTVGREAQGAFERVGTNEWGWRKNRTDVSLGGDDIIPSNKGGQDTTSTIWQGRKGGVSTSRFYTIRNGKAFSYFSSLKTKNLSETGGNRRLHSRDSLFRIGFDGPES